jgi:hypothetical protein
MVTELLFQILKTTPWYSVATATVALASAITAVTPTPKKGTKLANAYKVVDFLALNIGKAKQK